MNHIKVIQPKLKDINEQFIKDLQIAFPVKEENPSWNLKKTKDFVSNKANILLIAYMKDYMAGYLYGHTLDRFDNTKEFFIYSLYTSKAYRREKVMSQILEWLLDYLKTHKYESAWVLTNKSNKPAVSFYTNTGGSIPNGDDIMFEYKTK